MKKSGKLIAAALAAGFGACCLLDTQTTAAGVAIGLRRCLTTVIPALYAMMIASGLLLRTGLIAVIGRPLDRLSRLFFGLDGVTLATFLFSRIAGYPVGPRLIAARVASGELSREQGQVYSGLCFGAGTAFVFGCAAFSPAAGRLIFISTAIADLLTALLLSPWSRRHISAPVKPRRIAISPGMLTDSVSSAGRGMAEICFAVTAFSAVTELLRKYGVIGAAAAVLSRFTDMLPEAAEGTICAVLDVTAAGELRCFGYPMLPVTAALVSLGGVCVYTQIAAIFRGKLSILPLVMIRAGAAFLSFWVCRGLMPMFIAGETVTAAAMVPRLHREQSAVPSVMLVLMTGFLLFEAGKTKRLHPKVQPVWDL